MNELQKVSPKSSASSFPGSPGNSELPGARGSLNSEPYECGQNEIVIDCAKMWEWMKPSYKKSALIICGMDALLKDGYPAVEPNANTYMMISWNRLPTKWQDRLKRYFVQ